MSRDYPHFTCINCMINLWFNISQVYSCWGGHSRWSEDCPALAIFCQTCSYLCPNHAALFFPNPKPTHENLLIWKQVTKFVYNISSILEFWHEKLAISIYICTVWEPTLVKAIKSWAEVSACLAFWRRNRPPKKEKQLNMCVTKFKYLYNGFQCPFVKTQHL